MIQTSIGSGVKGVRVGFEKPATASPFVRGAWGSHEDEVDSKVPGW